MINNCLDKLKKLAQLMILAGSYAHLAVSVDQTNTENLQRRTILSNIASDIESRISFIESEIIELDEEIINQAIEESKENANYLRKIIRKKNMLFFQK